MSQVWTQKEFSEVSKRKGYTVIQKGYIFIQKFFDLLWLAEICKQLLYHDLQNHRFWLDDIDWSRDRIDLILVPCDSEASIYYRKPKFPSSYDYSRLKYFALILLSTKIKILNLF